ncbi:GUN4 domain-containing protein [Microcystis sp. BLCC-F210]|uniref:GUN4 domain-containing protein n=1 Tax=Microcystis sp. BLCC-F210 TaxID=3342751 RepID=UPI0035C8F936
MPLDKIAADALIYAGGAAFSALVSSGNNAWSASENRKSSESISRLNRDSSEEIARLSRKHSAELQYNQLKFSVLQQRENQEFQRELAELNHERAKEIEAFRAQVNFAINQKNLDFQKWRFEQEKKIQYDILQLQQDFQRDLTQIQHQNALIQMRERLREDKSPIANLASDLLENSFAHGIMPLKVLLAPPSLDYDPSSGKPYQASYEGFLSKEIEQFLHQGYLNSKQYPVQLLDKAWESNKRGGGSALQALHAQLKSIPILVLESEIPLGELNFRAGYWSGGDVSYTQATILSGQSVADLLNNSAKKRALEWEITRQKLQSLGKDEAYIKNMGGVNEENLQIFYKELAEKEELEKHGIDTSNLPIGKEYKITDQDYKSFYSYLAVWHCLVIGLYADILFLGNSWENTPLLPSLIPYLLEKYKNHSFLTSEFWQMGISTVVKAYGQFYDTLKSDAPSCLPEIRMKLALSLANLPSQYQYLALEQGNKAFSDWLRANDAPSDKVFDLDNDADCQLLKRIIYQEDQPFLESLKLLLEKVKDADGIDGSQSAGINSLLAGWQLLNRFGNIPHLPAMEVVSERMIVEEKLKHEEKTITPIADFTKLDYLLSQQAWKQAEEETLAMMFKIMNKSRRSDYLGERDFLNFPHIELEIIDRLWRKYSGGKFGFSVQKKIWIDCGGEAYCVDDQTGLSGGYDADTFLKFGEKLGWRHEIHGKSWYFDLTNNLIEAPQGHRPCLKIHPPYRSTIMGSPSDGICWTGLLSLYSSLNYEEQE